MNGANTAPEAHGPYTDNTIQPPKRAKSAAAALASATTSHSHAKTPTCRPHTAPTRARCRLNERPTTSFGWLKRTVQTATSTDICAQTRLARISTHLAQPSGRGRSKPAQLVIHTQPTNPEHNPIATNEKKLFIPELVHRAPEHLATEWGPNICSQGVHDCLNDDECTFADLTHHLYRAGT